MNKQINIPSLSPQIQVYRDNHIIQLAYKSMQRIEYDIQLTLRRKACRRYCVSPRPQLFSLLFYLLSGKVADEEKREERKVKSEENQKEKPHFRATFLFGRDGRI